MRFRAAGFAGLMATAAGIVCSVPQALATGSPVSVTPTVTVVLRPSSAASSGSAPAASPHIVCTVTLSQHVHYSKPGNDISWHWPWSCSGGAVSLYGNQSLLRNGAPWEAGPVSASNRSSGNENMRYSPCVNGTWQGQASGTFTRPGYTPSSWEGASPAQPVTSC